MIPEEKMPQERIESLLNRIKPKPSPLFYQRIQNQPWFQERSVPKLNKIFTPRLAGAFIWTTIFVLIFSLLSPTLKVVAQRWLQFFLPAHGNQATVQVPQINLSDLDFSLTIPEAEDQAGFHAIQPAYIPNGYRYIGAAYQLERQAIVIKFVTEGNRHQLRISQRPQGLDFQKIGVEAEVEIVNIGEISGEYVSGAWTIPEVKSSRDEITDGQTPTLEISWDPEAGIQILRWQKDQMLFEIIYAGSSAEGADILTKIDLIAIANSMH